jgi:hypothetical protein
VRKVGIIFLFVLSVGLYGQQQLNFINDNLTGYNIDGQEHNLKLEDSKSGKIVLSFIEGFQYRFIISSKTVKKYKIELFDIEKKLLFSSLCDNYTKVLDFYFKSYMACYVEITANEPSSQLQQFTIGVGYKKVNPEKFK